MLNFCKNGPDKMISEQSPARITGLKRRIIGCDPNINDNSRFGSPMIRMEAPRWAVPTDVTGREAMSSGRMPIRRAKSIDIALR